MWYIVLVSLDQSFYTFPDTYNVFKKDCTIGIYSGGVFLCIKKHLQVLEELSLDVEAGLN